jgi:thiamine-phosphate pyrophosphorylase
MADRYLLYYITERRAFTGDESARRQQLLEKIAEAACAGVDYIQLREKDLPTRDLETLAREAASLLAKLRTDGRACRTALLINSRTDVAMAVGADGVHLRSEDISPREVKKIWGRGANTPARESAPQRPLIAVSCHSPEELTQAEACGADFAVFAPVFEKKDSTEAPPQGLARLRQACRANIPVLALGGITLSNARACLEAGAAGIAGIRLFQQHDVAEIVRALR